MSTTARIPEMTPAEASLLWFVLVVEPRHEASVEEELRAHGLTPYLPKYTVKRKPFHGRKRVDVKRPLLPGYLLLGVDMPFIDARFGGWAVVRGADGVRGVLGTSDGRPLRVPWGQVEAIQVAEDMGLFDEQPNLTIGQGVVVLEGPFAGFAGPVTAYRDRTLKLDTPIGALTLTVEQVRRVG